ncbi:MAG: hypothetical protein E5X51_05955 [Mesorhizobium sp.]|uniref:hypothetical protein n=1 Tax=Mesorhizobium sp. TaxID=1871066 RepID=UPI001207975A|nr:hypothetical protein [Mesorhizobium sp.]TIQ22741.1 MAG: hypothetical protein E5X51_05955 [Mesorhizobium sp.]
MTNKSPTLAHSPVEVSALDFYQAVAKLPQMRRAPAGARGSIPKDTRLSTAPSGIMVETPIMGSLVNSSLTWRVQVSADARKLLDLCERYKKLGAYKEPKSVFLVSVADGELRVKF